MTGPINGDGSINFTPPSVKSALDQLQQARVDSYPPIPEQVVAAAKGQLRPTRK